jgi:hypothetical protein
MTKKQIANYEICKKYKQELFNWRDTFRVPNNYFSSSTKSPKIQKELADIHAEMYHTIIKAFHKAIQDVLNKIDDL